MPCRFAAGMVTDDFEGRLAGARGAFYRFHMRICPFCQAFRAQVAEVARAAGELRDEETAAPDPKVMAAFRDKYRGEKLR